MSIVLGTVHQMRAQTLLCSPKTFTYRLYRGHGAPSNTLWGKFETKEQMSGNLSCSK